MPISDNLRHLVGKHKNVEVEDNCWSEVGDGWIPIVEDALKKISQLTDKTVKILQIKEKFGELCLYASIDKSEQNGMFRIAGEAASLSRKTCEFCGRSGRLRGYYPDGIERHWIKTLCDECNIDKSAGG